MVCREPHIVSRATQLRPGQEIREYDPRVYRTGCAVAPRTDGK
jgi:hypothetical protein